MHLREIASEWAGLAALSAAADKETPRKRLILNFLLIGREETAERCTASASTVIPEVEPVEPNAIPLHCRINRSGAREAADIYMFQYHGQIDASVLRQMQAFAVAKSQLTSDTVYYGVIDGQDSQRLRLAYPEAFASKAKNTKTKLKKKAKAKPKRARKRA